MIRLTSKPELEGYGLLLQGKELTVTQALDDYLLIEDEIKITIKPNANVTILDVTNGKNIEITILENANLLYQIVNSTNSQRLFNNYGNLDIIQINLSQTTEKLVINNKAYQANSNVELLSFGNGTRQLFEQYVSHDEKETTSNISNYGFAINGADVSFETTGKIYKGKSKSKCAQLSKGIIMDDNSAITSKPILLIDEYDVIANHGASIGKMSDDILFYLMSRGLNKNDAFILILEGIIGPFIEKILDEDIKTEISQKLHSMIKE